MRPKALDSLPIRGRCWPRVALALLLATVTDSMAQTEGTVTCVPGEQKAWRCSRDGSEPEAAPLPELQPTQAAVPGPDVFTIPDPADDPSQTVSPIDTLMPMPAAPTPASDGLRTRDLYTLKIASVSEVDEIPGFVDSFGLDPALVRYMAVVEGDKARQLILWGSFVTPVQASRAVVAMPNAVQAMRPQIAEVAKLSGPLYDYASLAAGEAPVEALAATPGPVVETADPAESPAPSATPVAEPIAAPVAQTSPASNDDEPGQPLAESPAARDPDPVPEPAPAVSEMRTLAAATPVTAAPAPTLDDASAASEATPPRVETPTPTPAVEAVEEPTRTPAPATLTAASRRPAANPPPAPSPARERSGSAADSEGPAKKPAARARTAAVPVPPIPELPGVESLSALDPGAFVIQLTSLSKRNLLGLYLRRHGLTARELIAVSLDEGAGTRILLLKGGYNSLASAEAALTELPASIRSPWIRTVAPLQEALNQP